MWTAILIAGALAQTLAPGDRLPELKGDYLTKRKATLPADAKGKIALLLIGFGYDSRFPVEKFAAGFDRRFAQNPAVTFYEVPMIGGLGVMVAPFIDGGMRKGTPKEKHENVVTVYGGVDPWKERTGMQNDKDAHLVLIDRNGIVRWLYRGAYSDEALQRAIAAADQLAAQP